jgi:translation initiation factor eIF-2B subunit epsilon
VSNVDLTSAIDAHKARKEVDKNAIMTMVLKQGSINAKSCNTGDDSLFIMNSSTNEILYYHGLDGRMPKSCSLDLDVFDKNDELEARMDLVDCRIDICSIEVPALFTENFDYQDIRKDFVRGILESDLLGKTIYAHILTDKYAARVTCPYMYDLVSKDIMGRWTYPVVPDSDWAGNSKYELIWPYTYRDSNVVLTSSTVVSGKSAIGSGSSIGRDTRIKDSVIGKNVSIGAKVVLDGAYIMDDCVIGDGCKVLRSIISNNVTLKSNVCIPKGCLVGSNVYLECDSVLEEYSQWCTQDDITVPFTPESDEEDFDFNRLSIGSYLYLIFKLENARLPHQSLKTLIMEKLQDLPTLMKKLVSFNNLLYKNGYVKCSKL